MSLDGKDGSPVGTADRAADQPAVALTAADQKHLATLEAKLQMVRDYTGSVADGLTTGFYLHGPGGCGKSYSVVQELDRRRVPFKLYNSRMTGRGLYNALETYPDAVHLLEDMEQLLNESAARGVLRSALWGQGGKDVRLPQERLVTWTTYKMEHQSVLTGGIIMIANCPFPQIPELDAVKTRIAYMQLAVSDNELIALMRKVSGDGFRAGEMKANPAECREVCDHLVEQARGLNRAMDMRTLINAFKDYLQWRECQSGCHWRDMVSTRLKERPISLEEVKTFGERATQKEAELAVAREVAVIANRQERFRLWKERTGKSEPTLYRRLDELKVPAFSDSQ